MSDSAALLKKALITGVSQRYAKELSRSPRDAACSPEHLQKMSDILGYDVRAAAVVRKRKLVFAALVLAAALAIGALTAYANRGLIRDFFIQFVEDGITLEFPGEQAPAIIAEQYIVDYVPPGFTLTKEEKLEALFSYDWTNEQGQMLRFTQNNLNVLYGFDSKYGESNIITHGGLQIYCMHYEECDYYVWNDGKYAMNIYDNSGLPLEEIINIIDSISTQSED